MPCPVVRIGMSLLLASLLLCPAFPNAEAASEALNSSSSVVQMVNTLGPLASTPSFNLLKIGAPASFTSQESAYFNQSSQLYNGWSLFVQWVNVGRAIELGGESGVMIGNQSFLVELVTVEDLSSSELAAQAAARLVHDSSSSQQRFNYSADFIFGPYSSPLTAATAQVTDPANVLLLSASSLHDPQGHCVDTELLLALQPPPATFAHSLFQTLQWLGAESVALVVDDVVDSYCQNATEMQALAELYNVTLAGFHAVDGEAYLSSLRGIVSGLQASSSPVDVVAGCPPRDQAGNPSLQTTDNSVCVQLPLMARNLSYSPSGLLFLNCDFEHPPTAAALGSAGTHLLSLVPWHPSPLIREEGAEAGSEGGSSGWSAEDFYFRYAAQFKTTPTYHAGRDLDTEQHCLQDIYVYIVHTQWCNMCSSGAVIALYSFRACFYF